MVFCVKAIGCTNIIATNNIKELGCRATGRPANIGHTSVKGETGNILKF